MEGSDLDPIVTPRAVEQVFCAQYHLAGLLYINGVTFEQDVISKGRAVRDLKAAQKHIERALDMLDPKDVE